MRRLYILFLTSLVFSLSCRESVDPTPFTYPRLLTGENYKVWRLAGIQFRENDKPLQSYNLPSDDCVFNDRYIFYNNSNRTFVIDEGASACNPGDPQIFLQDSWLLANSTATLEMVFPVLIPFRYPYIIKELTEDRLETEVYFSDAKQSYRMIFIEVETK